MYRVLVVERFHEEGLKLFEARPDIELEILDDRSPSAIAARIGAADAVTLRSGRLSADLIEKAPRLKVVSRHGVGYDAVDVAALTRRGIPLTVTVGANAVAVAEQTLFLMLALATQGFRNDRWTRESQWERGRYATDKFELDGKRLLIIGYGRIGRRVALRCEPFGMEIEAYDPYVDPREIGRAGFGHVQDLHEALPRTDVLTLHAPLTDETRHMIGARELAALPSSAIVINTARGGIIDEAALIAALQGGEIAGAGLDVFEREPPSPDNPLFRLENVVLSPHAAANTRESASRMAVMTARNTLAALDGGIDPAAVVNPEVL